MQDAQKIAENTINKLNPLKSYSQFRKKKAVISSLKLQKKKKKRYLRVKIRQLKKKGHSAEIGYQIRYASNKRFKKAKTIEIARKKNRYITSKSWKVKKGKTWYVKVRAYRITSSGKKIYSKYSRVKKIKS